MKIFGGNEHRQRLLAGLNAAALNLRNAGCTQLYVDGSFATAKTFPNDYDACWNPVGVDLKRVDPVLLDFKNNRFAQKAKYLGELFPSTARADNKGNTFLQFFQLDRESRQKGIVLIELRGLV